MSIHNLLTNLAGKLDGMFLPKEKSSAIQYSLRKSSYEEHPSLQDLLPWMAAISESGIVIDKSFGPLVVLRFRGPDMDSSTPNELMHENFRFNNIIKSLGTGFGLWIECKREYVHDYKHSPMPSSLLQKMDDDRAKYYNSQTHLENMYYLTIYQQPPFEYRAKALNLFIEDGYSKKDESKVFNDFLQKFTGTANEIASMLSNTFPDIEILDINETLTFLHSTVSNFKQSLVLNENQYICDYIVDCALLAGREPKLGDEHMKIITLKSFPPFSSPGYFEVLANFPFEYRWISRFLPLSAADAEAEIKKRQQEWSQQKRSPFTMIREAITKEPTGDVLDQNAINNEEDAAAGLAELQTDLSSFGFYTMSVIVKDENYDLCQAKANKILEAVRTRGFTGQIETDNAMEAWWGSLPGVYGANIRRPLVSSLNFTHLSPIEATWAGDSYDETLNAPVLLYTDTIGHTPFRFSLHCGTDVGHTLIVGPSGSGKSVLLNTIEAHFLKYKNCQVYIFDKAASSRALTLGVNGHFYNLAAETKGELSFQPLSRIDDSNEKKWAKEWLLNYLRLQNMIVTPEIDNYVWEALDSLTAMPVDQRTISMYCTLVQNQDIRLALRQLTISGSYGSLFDNNTDVSGSGNWQVYEMETLMATPAIVPPTLDYLFHRIETKVKDALGPTIIVLDECWLFLNNDAFRGKLKEYFKDLRKKNASIIIATQNLSDISAKGDLLPIIMDNCPNRIYLPNINANNTQNVELYKAFGLNERQIEIITEMTPKQDYYYTSQKGNRIFKLALRDSEIPFICATSKNDQIAINNYLQERKGEKWDSKKFIRYWLQIKQQPEVLKDLEENYFAKEDNVQYA